MYCIKPVRIKIKLVEYCHRFGILNFITYEIYNGIYATLTNFYNIIFGTYADHC